MSADASGPANLRGVFRRVTASLLAILVVTAIALADAAAFQAALFAAGIGALAQLRLQAVRVRPGPNPRR